VVEWLRSSVMGTKSGGSLHDMIRVESEVVVGPCQLLQGAAAGGFLAEVGGKGEKNRGWLGRVAKEGGGVWRAGTARRAMEEGEGSGRR
jgi:hypothetical protein